MKILLADDEKLVRASLKSMLKEIDFSLHTIEEATNGTDMVEKLKNFQADIAFVDIQMPGLTGLEAIKLGKTISPATQWIILTGYSEFSYAQKAIKLGASDYLLKPVCPDDLHKALEKAANYQRESFSKLNRQFENDISSYFHGINTISELHQIYQNTTFSSHIIIIDSVLEEKEKTNRITPFCNRLQQMMNDGQTNEVRFALFPLSNRELAFITAWTAQESVDFIDEYMKKVNELLSTSGDQGFSITMISSTPSPLENTKILMDKMKDCASFRTILGINRQLFLHDIENAMKHKDISELSQILINLSENYLAKSSLNYFKLLEELSSLLPKIEANSVKENLCTFLSCLLPCQLDENENAEQWINNLRNCGEKLLKNTSKDEDRSQFLVDQVIAYVAEHYMNDIGIGQIAQDLQVTPNYLSTLFHKKMGTTFIKYLTKIRILKAQELLTNPKNQVQKVAEAVGYYSTRHFTKLFTEQVGSYPSEFQKNFRTKAASSIQ